MKKDFYTFILFSVSRSGMSRKFLILKDGEAFLDAYLLSDTPNKDKKRGKCFLTITGTGFSAEWEISRRFGLDKKKGRNYAYLSTFSY